jgi:hypothetical protein
MKPLAPVTQTVRPRPLAMQFDLLTWSTPMSLLFAGLQRICISARSCNGRQKLLRVCMNFKFQVAEQAVYWREEGAFWPVYIAGMTRFPELSHLLIWINRKLCMRFPQLSHLLICCSQRGGGTAVPILRKCGWSCRCTINIIPTRVSYVQYNCKY